MYRCRLIQLCALILLSSVAIGSASPDKVFRVTVMDDKDVTPMSKVHVFILAADGRVLSEGYTDGNGDVSIRKPDENEHPAFLLAEKSLFFIGGMRWDPGFDQRLIHLAPFAQM